MLVTRRRMMAMAAAGSAAAWLGSTPLVSAAGRGLLVDYSRGVPRAEALRAAGYAGAIRYVSDRRPGAEWMLGKPLRSEEVAALRACGLQVVSCYQYGKAATADWRGGYAAGVRHAARGLELHRAAGGPANRPIYASIDDNPTAAQFTELIAPYLRGWQAVLGADNVGVYANAPTIERARTAGLGRWYWQHDWGSPAGYVHPAAHLHQLSGRGGVVDGIDIDVNAILMPDYGQW
jgi:hypothetical protein